MIDFKNPEIQQELKKYNRYIPNVVSVKKIDNTRVVNKYGIESNFGYRNRQMFKAYLLSEVNPFETSPIIWKKINKSNVLYVCYWTGRVFSSKGPLIKTINTYISKHWRTDLCYHAVDVKEDEKIFLFEYNKYSN